MKYILVAMGLFLGAGSMAYAQDLRFTKDKQVRKLIRLGKTKDAQLIINDLLKDKGKKKDENSSEEKDSTEYFFLTGLIKYNQFEQENLKLYLKNKPDTVAYFARWYETVDAFDRCYPAIESLKKEHAEIKSLLAQHMDKMERGGNFYLAKNRLDDAYRFFHKYVRLADKQLFTPTAAELNRNYYNTAFVAGKLGDYETLLFYGRELVKRGETTEEVDLLLCDALNKMGRIDEWKQALKDAVERHPESFYFYAALIDYYISQGANDRALLYADELMRNDPMNGLKNFVKGYAYQNLGDYHNAIIWMEVCNRLSPGIPENLSALGYNYVSLAEQYAAKLRGNYITPEAKKELNDYYSKAKMYLEECRLKVPEKKDFWAPALYKVYYNLNEGDALDEIERILHDGE